MERYNRNDYFARVLGVFLMSIIMALSALAQETPKAEISGTYSQIPSIFGASCHGGGGSLALNLNRWVDAVAELNGCKSSIESFFGSSQLGTNTTFSYLFGPRLSYRSRNRLTPFTQILFGGAHGSTTLSPGNHRGNTFSMSAGFGLDVRLIKGIAVRLIQLDYFMTRFGGFRQNKIRFQTGIVFRIGTQKEH